MTTKIVREPLIPIRVEALVARSEYRFLKCYGAHHGITDMTPERAYKALALWAIHEAMARNTNVGTSTPAPSPELVEGRASRARGSREL